MNTTTAPKAEPRPTSSGDSDLGHLYCCDPNLALCGADLTDTPEMGDDEDADCVVCTDLAVMTCPACGWKP